MDVTRYLAIYADVLFAAVFVRNVARARPKFDVKLVPILDETVGEYTSGIYVSLQNPSAHTVHISNVSFLYRYEETGLIDRVKHAWEFKRLMPRIGWVHNSMIFDGIETGLPVSLEPGKSHMIFAPYDTIDDMLERGIDRKIIAGAQDALWRNKFSAVLDFSVMRDPDKDETDGGDDDGVYIARSEIKQIEQREAAPEDAATSAMVPVSAYATGVPQITPPGRFGGMRRQANRGRPARQHPIRQAQLGQRIACRCAGISHCDDPDAGQTRFEGPSVPQAAPAQLRSADRISSPNKAACSVKNGKS